MRNPNICIPLSQQIISVRLLLVVKKSKFSGVFKLQLITTYCLRFVMKNVIDTYVIDVTLLITNK